MKQETVKLKLSTDTLLILSNELNHDKSHPNLYLECHGAWNRSGWFGFAHIKVTKEDITFLRKFIQTHILNAVSSSQRDIFDKVAVEFENAVVKQKNRKGEAN